MISRVPFSHLATAERTDIGLCRMRNEDAIIRMPEAGVFCVADGIGGGQGGHEASAATVRALMDTFDRADASGNHPSFAQRKDLVREAMNEACEEIHRNGVANGYLQTGTTTVTLVFDVEHSGQAAVLHAGDSRAYVYRDGQLRRLTRDHSLAMEAGLTTDTPSSRGNRNIITRALGVRPCVELDETAVEVHAGDVFMLCTDGLTNMLHDREIAELFQHHGTEDLDHVISQLVDEANRAGGRDNITVLLVRVDAPFAPGPGDFPGPASGRIRQLIRRWFTRRVRPASGVAFR